jgi:cytochrome c-type biogenesis protein CcmH/NrfG
VGPEEVTWGVYLHWLAAAGILLFGCLLGVGAVVIGVWLTTWMMERIKIQNHARRFIEEEVDDTVARLAETLGKQPSKNNRNSEHPAGDPPPTPGELEGEKLWQKLSKLTRR